jgi:signal transduction histidine kinase
MEALALVRAADGTSARRPEATATSIGSLIASDAWVRPDEPVRDVAERFFRRAELDAVALVEGGRPVGLLTRARLLLKLARGFGQELYARKPVARIADLAPLVVPAAAPLGEAIERALERAVQAVYEEVIVVDGEGRFLGLLPVRDLVLHQSVAFARGAAEHEASMARTRDLEKLEKLRGQFLAHATHELRSPVNAIAVLAELVRLACARDDLGAVKEKLPLLLRATAGLRGTVNNILDLSKLEAGKTDVALATVPLLPLLEDVACTTRLLVGQKPVRVGVEAAPGLALETDRHKLRQILVNLASNAAKFTEQGEVVLSAAREGEGMRLAVRDTGAGIREEDLGRLFVPFGQLEDALTKAHEGTGLGLVISRSLGSLLGGRVEVQSRFGEGSTFTVHLPGSPPRST